MREDYVKYLEQLREQMNTAIKPIEDVLKSLEPIFNKISYEYNVNQKEFNEANERLITKGYFLPLMSTPRDYIEMNSACKDDVSLEEYYIDILEEDNSIMGLMEAFSKEPMSRDWHEPIRISHTLVKNCGIDETYSLILPFYYAFFESLIRNKLDKRGKDLRPTYKIFEEINKSISQNKNLDENTEEYYKSIISSSYSYFYKRFGRPEDVSRNSVQHGYSTPKYWKKVELYKLISATTLVMYILV